jgi:hypothetical protein
VHILKRVIGLSGTLLSEAGWGERDCVKVRRLDGRSKAASDFLIFNHSSRENTLLGRDVMLPHFVLVCLFL